MERLLAILYIITVYLVADHAANANRRPIRSVLAPAETITDYETVSPIIIYQSAETTHGNPHDLWIKFDLPTKTFELHLTMNKILLSPKYTESSVENGKTILNKERKNCFYHGTVVGFPEWTVAMSTCVGLRGTFGDHSDVDTLYHIEPLEKTTNEIEQTHIVFTSAHLSVKRKNGTCGCNESHIITSHHQNITVPFDRVRRQSATRIVEWFVFNDRRQFIAQQQSLSATTLHTIEIANTVDVLYAKIGVRVSLVGVETWSQQDLIAVVSDADALLDNFKEHVRFSTEEFDSTMLITGIDLDGSTIGLAPIGAMCRGRISAGLTQDTGASLASVSSTAAHELGHIFNMRHDDGRSCTCAGTNSRCIMSGTLSRPPPVEWSSCSVSDLNEGYADGLDSCLFNEPTDIVGDPICGNGIREGEEVCDCGDPDLCDDPCCNPNTCQLADGAVCSNRDSCCSNCQFRTSGTVCRSAKDECDITEFCTGTSGECPDDRSRQDGADCANSQAYCASGVCQNLDTICNATFAPNGGTPSAGFQECFDDNTQGEDLGNCGHTSTAYIACATDDVRCGQLHCRNAGEIQLSFSTSIRISTSFAIVNQQFVTCRSYTTFPGDDVILGLVPEGAKCGTNRLCRNRRCVARQLTACPSANTRECSGNGVCNDLNQCSCNPGYTGANCNSLVNGGGVNGGWTQWSSWSTCTVTCGVGSRTRTRSCTDPAPIGDGADCVGPISSTESCNIVACPVNVGWGSWTTAWSSCSVTCGSGQKIREQFCSNSMPSGEAVIVLVSVATSKLACPITVTENPTATSGPNGNTNVTRNSGGGGGSGAAIGGAVAGIVITLVIIVIIVLVVIVLYRRRRATKFLPVATSSRNELDFAYRKPQSSNGFDNTRGSVYPTRSAVPPRPTNPPSRPTNPPSVSSYNPPPVIDQPSQPQRRGAPPPPTKTQLYPKVSSQTQAPPRPQAHPKPQAPLKPQAPSKPQAPPRPPAPTAPPKPQVSSKPEVASIPKPREWPPQSHNADGWGGPPVAAKKPLRPPPRNH